MKSPSWRPVAAVVDVGVGPELCDHDLELGGIEIPAERARDERAEGRAKRIEAPALQFGPLSDADPRGVEAEVDARVAERADRGHGEEARPAVVGGEVRRVGEREPKAGDDSARRARGGRDRPRADGRRRAAFRRRCRRPSWRAERAPRRARGR